MESNQSEILNLEEILGKNSDEYNKISAVVKAALFSSDDNDSISAVKALHRSRMGINGASFNACYAKEGRIYLEMNLPVSDNPIWFYIGEAPEIYLGKRIDPTQKIFFALRLK